MLRHLVGVFALVSVLGAAGEAIAQRLRGELIAEHAALRHGLHRAWVTQIELDRARGRVAHITLADGLLLVQTDQAAIHVLDAETGRTLWVAHVGRPNYPTTPLAADDRFVAASNGSMLYLLDRKEGFVVWEQKVDGIASAGAVLGGRQVYVPLTNGKVVSYDLDSPTKRPLFYRGSGMADAEPVVAENNLVWGTATGRVEAASLDELGARFRFRAKGPVTAALSFRRPFVFAASRDGYVYAIDEVQGTTAWQFSSGDPIVHPPVVIGDGLYVVPETGGMFRLSVNSGALDWWAPAVFQFVAASPTRLYTADSIGRLLVLDAKTGARLDMLATEKLPLKLLNTRTDRLYLATRTGLIQCLREQGLTEPVSHVPAAAEEPQPPASAPAAAEEAPAEGEEPDMPADEAEDVFGDDAPPEEGEAEMPDGQDGEAPAEEEEEAAEDAAG